MPAEETWVDIKTSKPPEYTLVDVKYDTGHWSKSRQEPIYYSNGIWHKINGALVTYEATHWRLLSHEQKEILRLRLRVMQQQAVTRLETLLM